MRALALAVAIVAGVVFGGFAVMLGGSSGAYAANGGTTCTGTLGGGTSTQINGVWTGTATPINGNVTVPGGASCTLNFVNVAGNVTVQSGGSLLVTGVEPSTISGNVTAAGCVSTLIQGIVTVNGNVSISNCTGSAANGYTGPGVAIGGSFTCQNNAGPCEAWLGQVTGSATIQNNGGAASDVSVNNIGGDLTCQNNASALTHAHGTNWVQGSVQGQCTSDFSTTTTSLQFPPSGGMSCAALASLSASGFPVPHMVVTSATTATVSGVSVCTVELTYNPTYVSPVSGCNYLDQMQVEMPTTTWNGRFFYGSADGGSVGDAAATQVADGYASATDNAGISSTAMAACGNGDKNQYFPDPYGAYSNTNQTDQISTLVGKYIVAEYYGQNAVTSYTGGCSGPGAHSMMFSQQFPNYYDGIYSGSPGNNFQKTHLAQIWNTEQVQKAYLAANPPLSPATPATIANPDATETPKKLFYPAFPTSDQTLFMTALLQACDALDGVADGVVDNPGQCEQVFNPATATYVNSSGQTLPLQCPTSTKAANCLSASQIAAMVAWNSGAVNSSNQPIIVPSGANGTYPQPYDASSRQVLRYPYDGGWGGSGTNNFAEFVGANATSAPGAYAPDWGFFVYGSLSPPNPMFDPTEFNYNTQLGLLSPTMDWSTFASSLNITAYVNLGHKIFWYHGMSDPLHPLDESPDYYNSLANMYGGVGAIQSFSRLYLVPGMEHCGGGPSTSTFDVIDPLQQWVENGVAPGALAGTGTAFDTASYDGVTSYGVNSQAIAASSSGAGGTRSRPICPYPTEARFTGATTVVNGQPVATSPAALAVSTNYQCVTPSVPYAAQ